MKKEMNLSVQKVLKEKEREILEAWMREQLASVTLRGDLMSTEDLRKESIVFLRELVKTIGNGNLEDIESKEYIPIIDLLKKIAINRLSAGFTPSETASFVFSLKNSILQFLKEVYKGNAELLNQEMLRINSLLDKLGLVTYEEYSRGREEIFKEQQLSILELSTPVMSLWDEVIAIPIIGILDSRRTQQIMETLLNTIVERGSKICIIDITGVAVMDTQVSAHLIKTGNAISLLGAEAVLTGVRPEVAQTIVHLGVDLSFLITRATMADGLIYAFHKLGLKVERR